MRWRIIPKHLRASYPPAPGTYREWKSDLAEEGGHQCVYCALADARFGGEYNFHVEHFEPKSRAPHRINEWDNLFYACPICNVFKGNDWPMPGTPNAYMDPSKINYETQFKREKEGIISGVTVGAKYMVERLYLNRPQLRLERREAELHHRLRRLRTDFEALRNLVRPPFHPDREVYARLSKCLDVKARIDDLIDSLRTVSPYRRTDVRRPQRGHE